MLKGFRLFVCCLVALTLSACAFGMQFTEMNPSTAPKDQDTGRIFFYRTTVFGFALQPDIRLNGTKVGDAVPHGFFYVDRPPGNYEVVVTSNRADRKLTFVLDTGQTRFVKFSLKTGCHYSPSQIEVYSCMPGHVYGELVDPAVGLKEIKEQRYTGAEESPK